MEYYSDIEQIEACGLCKRQLITLGLKENPTQIIQVCSNKDCVMCIDANKVNNWQIVYGKRASKII